MTCYDTIHILHYNAFHMTFIWAVITFLIVYSRFSSSVTRHVTGAPFFVIVAAFFFIVGPVFYAVLTIHHGWSVLSLVGFSSPMTLSTVEKRVNDGIKQPTGRFL